MTLSFPFDTSYFSEVIITAKKKTGFFYETVAPLLCIGSTSFIAISTLTTDLNFYTKLISKFDPLTNKPMFKSVQIQLACQACIDAERAHECNHMAHLIPRWQDSDKHRRLKIIMSDRSDLINSELGGIAVGNCDQAFKAVDLKRAFSSTIYLNIPTQMDFYVCIDPCAGGEHSDFACVSFLICNGITKILGAESLNTKDPIKCFTLLKTHIVAVRNQYSELYFSVCKLIIERNLGFEAEHMYRETRGMDNVAYLKQPNSERIGCLTTQDLKLGFVTYLNILLRENRFFVTPEAEFVDLNKSKSREMLLDQLCFFSFTFNAPETVMHKEKFAISGKSAGGKDDLAMACQIGVFHAQDERFIYIR
jgi:hypothetical protein